MNIEVIRNCAYSTMVMAATPDSPAYCICRMLNRKVVTATARLFTISDEPLVQLCSSTLPRKTGRTRYSVPRRAKVK